MKMPGDCREALGTVNPRSVLNNNVRPILCQLIVNSKTGTFEKIHRSDLLTH
jgi:hypothetical protein